MGFALLSPPLAFLVLFLVILGLFHWTKILSATGDEAHGKRLAYYCGEETTSFSKPASGGSFAPITAVFLARHLFLW